MESGGRGDGGRDVSRSYSLRGASRVGGGSGFGALRPDAISSFRRQLAAEPAPRSATRAASTKASRVRAPSPRRMALSLENACSIGVKSGEYGGRKSSAQPRAASASRMRAALWTLTLSRTTTCPGRSVGASCFGDVPSEGGRVHRPLEHPGDTQPVGCQRRDQRGVRAAVARHRIQSPAGHAAPSHRAASRRCGSRFRRRRPTAQGRARRPTCARRRAPPHYAHWLPMIFFMRPAEAMQGAPHADFAQLLPLVLRPPGACSSTVASGAAASRARRIASCSPRIARCGPGLACARASRSRAVAPQRVSRWSRRRRSGERLLAWADRLPPLAPSAL